MTGVIQAVKPNRPADEPRPGRHDAATQLVPAPVADACAFLDHFEQLAAHRREPTEKMLWGEAAGHDR